MQHGVGAPAGTPYALEMFYKCEDAVRPRHRRTTSLSDLSSAMAAPQLIIADECFLWPNAHNLPAHAFPTPLPVGRQFPLPPPLIARAGHPMREAVRAPFIGAPLAQGPRRTNASSQTKIATTIQDLQLEEGEKLKYVYRSEEFWPLLVQYAFATGQGVLNPTAYAWHRSHGELPAAHPMIPLLVAGPQGPPPPAPPLQENAWSPPVAPPGQQQEWQLPIAPVEQRANAVLSLAEHYSQHRRKAESPVLVNSEPGVQDEFLQQFLVPLGYVLQVSGPWRGSQCPHYLV